MNKYQEALINLVTHNYSTRSEKNEHIKTLQELVDKETPMKPFKTEYIDTHENVYVGICPNCKNENPQFKHQNYCWNCGQKLDWSDECE